MKNIITILILIFLLPNFLFAAETQDILYVAVHFDHGRVNIENLEVGFGFVPEKTEINPNAPAYWLEIIADSGEVLVKKQFNINLEIMLEPPLPGEEYDSYIHEKILEETTELVAVPYFPNLKWAYLYDGNYNFLEKKEIAYLSQICGNGICQNDENYVTCPNDCKENGKDGYCSPGMEKTDTDCFAKGEFVNTTTFKNNSNIFILTIIIIIFLIIVLLLLFGYLFVRRKRNINKDGSDNTINKI